MPQQGSGGRKGEVTLPQGKPFVHPGASPAAVDHAAVFEAAKNQRRAQHALPKTRTPVAGGQAPAIPNLTGAPQRPGMTMAQHAALERVAPQATAPAASGFVEPALEIGPNQVPMSAAQLGLLPTDELHPKAKEDPAFISGTGSMFAANQPALAMKYGVIRQGKHVPPQQLRSPVQQRQLRPETVRDLQELNALQQRQEKEVLPEDGEEASDMGKAAGDVGIPSMGKALSQQDREEIRDTLKELDEFDFDKWRQSMMKDLLNNEEQKKIIEARLKPLDVGDLITQGYIIQRVEIVPGKFWVDFKTLDGETDLALKRLIMDDSRSVEVSERYYLDKFGLMSVVAVIHKINDRPFSDIVDDKGNFDDDKFRAKFSKVLKLPIAMLASIGVNAFWFDIRVRKLFVAEAVGNG